MAVDLLVKNGWVVTPQRVTKASISIADGKIAGIFQGGLLPKAKEEYDAEGKYVLPGLIDVHVHFREPGITYKEDFMSGSLAAAYGGITTFLDMPNVQPPTATAEALKLKLAAVREKSYIDFGLYGVILQDNLKEIKPMAEEGVAGFKVFLGTSVGNLPAPDDGVLLEGMKVIAQTGLRLGFHAENNEIVNYHTLRLKQAGFTGADIFPASRPNEAEAEAIAKVIRFAEMSAAKVHIFHMSSQDGVELVAGAKAKGLNITAETAPHYLFLNAEDYRRLGSMLKINPPVRTGENSAFLWQGLLDGTIEVIATDHSPHTIEEKMRPNIWEAMPGFCGVETNVPLMLTAVNEGRLSIRQYVKAAAEGPAKAFNIYPQKGSLLLGTDADLTIVDMNSESVIKAENLHSKNKVTPFDGFKVKGLPVTSLVRGQFVLKDGEVAGLPGWGRLVRPE